MHLIPSRMPEPRLLSSAVRNLPKTAEPAEDSSGRSRLKGDGLFTGNGRAIFIGLGVAAVVIFGSGWIFERHLSLKHDEVAVPKVIPVITQSVLGPPPSNATPRPVVVHINADVLRVSAIVLGHPRLAVINGHSVAEGDTFVLHTPTKSVAVTLRVLKISDGQIELSDGTQVITARLNIPTLAPAKVVPK